MSIDVIAFISIRNILR